MMVIHECHVLEPQTGMNADDHRSFLALLKQQQERPEKFRPEWEFKPRPLRCRYSALPVELPGQLGAGNNNNNFIYIALIF